MMNQPLIADVPTAAAAALAAPAISVPVIVDFLNKVILAEPKFLSLYKTVRPYAAHLPAPFNLIADPTVQALVEALPQLLPLLIELQQLLATAADSK